MRTPRSVPAFCAAALIALPALAQTPAQVPEVTLTRIDCGTGAKPTMVRNLNATVITQHDRRDIEKLPAFPAAAR